MYSSWLCSQTLCIRSVVLQSTMIAFAEVIFGIFSQMGILRRLAAQQWSNQAAAVQVCCWQGCWWGSEDMID